MPGVMRRGVLLSLAAVASLSVTPARAGLARPVREGAAAMPPPLLLASTYDPRMDPAAYLVSEKYDGVRAWWDGRTLRHRSGRTIAAPAWFTARLPAEALDGELWLERGGFDALAAIVRSARAGDDAWGRLHYMVFELPGAPGSFTQRAEAIQRIVARAAWDQLRAVQQSRVSDRAGLKRRLDEVIATGGEGLVLHLASAPYSTGRSEILAKLKPQLDAEATVVGYRAGHGKYDGSIGALRVRTTEGRQFFLGSGLPDAFRRRPPPPGSVVTYRYRDRTPNGLPRFASFYRLHEAL